MSDKARASESDSENESAEAITGATAHTPATASNRSIGRLLQRPRVPIQVSSLRATAAYLLGLRPLLFLPACDALLHEQQQSGPGGCASAASRFTTRRMAPPSTASGSGYWLRA